VQCTGEKKLRGCFLRAFCGFWIQEEANSTSEEDEEDPRCRKCRRRDCEKVESEDEDEEELIHRRVRQWRTLAMLHKICTSL
jgi:hypothetical protein